MTNRYRWLASLIAFAGLSSAAAADLTVYYGFAEVRDGVQVSGNRFIWTPPADLSGFIVPGSLALDYPGVASLTVLQPSPSLLAAFEGREVLVKRGDQTVKAKVLRADLALFEANGQFFQADPSTVTYPSLEGVRFAPQFVWGVTGQGGTANLLYLTRGLTWSPRYTLNLAGDAAKLESWADVRNAAGLEYRAPNLSLLAGEVNLAFEQPGPEFGGPRPTPALAARAAEDRVTATGESAGLQTFKYPQPVILPARATTSVPFVDAKASVERSFEYYNGFQTQAKTVVPLSRIYTLKSDADLPAGVITVREDGRMVGQTRIGDSPKAEGAVMNLGVDFDLRLTRTVQALERTKTTAKFKVAFNLTNTKNRPVSIKLREVIGNNFTLEQTVLPNLKRTEDGFTAAATLQPGARLEASCVVVLKTQ